MYKEMNKKGRKHSLNYPNNINKCHFWLHI